jgi:hypothetical protein
MKIHYCKVLGLLAAGLVMVAPAYGAPKEKASPNPEKTGAAKTATIDLRPRMKRMKLKDGPNLVYSGTGYKLTAMASRGKVVSWSATDLNGKPLPVNDTKDNGSGTKPILTCQVCVTINTGSGQTTSCSVVDCSILDKKQ